jgi:hypothetical protein
MVFGDGTEILQGCGGYTYEQGELRGAEGEERRGEERRGKEKDRCPLTLPPLQSMVSQRVKTARRLPGLL